METFDCRPQRGARPAVVFLMDAPGILDVLRDMAQRLATVGYFVMLPNLHDRAGRDSMFGPQCWKREAQITSGCERYGPK